MICPEEREEMKAHMRSTWKIERRKADPNVHRDLPRGWMLDAILLGDDMLHGRWEYWFDLMCERRLPDAPIPQIDFLDSPNSAVLKMLHDTLNCIPAHGSWESWGGTEYFRYFMDWFLYGVGHLAEAPKEREPGASDRLYQIFQPGAMQLYPYDYWGDMLSECSYGRHNGFFPTPLSLCSMMATMTMSEGDMRDKRINDPCVGTGRFPLVASNYSLRISGMDKDDLMVKATLFNAYLYAPWIAKPLPFLEEIPDAVAEDKPSQVVMKAEPDPEALRFEPIVKRRKVVAAQGELFDTNN